MADGSILAVVYTERASRIRLISARRATREPLPSWQGCTSLNEGQVFLLGDTAGSYDGRYFGVTGTREVVGRADLMLGF
jgi:type IV secretory pathway protease TraF